MDKTESYLTQTIVGKSQRMPLGAEVRYDGEVLLPFSQSGGFSDRWQGLFSNLFERLRGPARWAMGAIAVGIAASAGVVAYMQLAGTTNHPDVAAQDVPAESSPPIFPITPAPASVEAVTAIAVQEQPFIEDSGEVQDTDQGPLSSAPPPAGPLPTARIETASVQPARPLPSAPVAREAIKLAQPKPESPAPGSTALSKESPKQEPSNRLVLDIAPEAAEKTASSKPVSSAVGAVATGPATPAKGSKLVEPIEVGGGVAGQGVQQPQPNRPTIVTIAEDNSYVLITNPSTRLPQKFQVGQKLPSGATVQRIDHSKGVVQIDGQTFGLQ